MSTQDSGYLKLALRQALPFLTIPPTTVQAHQSLHGIAAVGMQNPGARVIADHPDRATRRCSLPRFGSICHLLFVRVGDPGALAGVTHDTNCQGWPSRRSAPLRGFQYLLDMNLWTSRFGLEIMDAARRVGLGDERIDSGKTPSLSHSAHG